MKIYEDDIILMRYSEETKSGRNYKKNLMKVVS
jgi:hypothetical protein